VRRVFAILAVGFLAGALYHAVALVDTARAEPAPPWRHALFVAVNLAAAGGVLARPRFFVWLFAALTAQQVYGHGTYGWRVWRAEGRVDWASVVVLVAMPLVLGLLARDALARRASPR
jgi:hypothetical protein